MIKPLPLFLSLLLVICNATDFTYKIEFDRCQKETACYIKQSCLEGFAEDGTTENTLVDFVGSPDPDFADKANCDVVVQIKAISKEKHLVVMQLTLTDADTDTFDVAKGIVIQQKASAVLSDSPVVQMGCVDDTKPGGHAEWGLEYEGTKPNPKFESKKMFCSFLKTKGFLTEPYRADGYDNNKPELIYHTTSGEKKLTYPAAGEAFWAKPQVKCRGDKITSTDDSSGDFYDLIQVDTSRWNIACPEGIQSKLLVKYDGKDSETDLVDCDTLSNEWGYGQGASRKKLVADKPIVISCIKTKYCTACAEMKKHACVASNECVAAEPEANRPDGCMVMKCPDDKWTLDGRGNFNNKDVTCKKNSQGKSDWVRQDVTDGTVPPTGLGCLKKALCRGPNEETDIKLNCPEGVEQCSPPVLKNDNQVMNCTEGLIFYVDGSPPVENPQCNDGLWSVKGEIYCAPPKEHETGEKVGTGGMSAGTIVAIIGVIVVVAVVGGLVYFFVVKPKMAKKTSKAAGPSKKGAKSSKKSTESKSGAKKPSDSDPPEKASGKEGGVTPDGVTPGGNTPGPTPVTDLEKIKTEPSGPKTPEVAAAPGGAPGAPPPPPAAPAPGQSAV